MKVKKMEHDAATGEYKEIYEEDLPAPEEPEIIQEQTLEEKVMALQEENAMLTACILEMSDLVYK